MRLNKVVLTGNLTKDPDIRYTQSGKAMARVSLAVASSYKKADGTPNTDFIGLVAWDKTAEFFGKYLAKGTRILVEGRLKNNNYKDNKGVMHYGMDVVVDNVEFAGAKKKAVEEDEGYPTDDGRSPDDDDMPF